MSVLKNKLTESIDKPNNLWKTLKSLGAHNGTKIVIIYNENK